MKELEEDIETIVLPQFINEQIDKVEWQNWQSAGPEESIVEVKINSKEYLLLEVMDGVLSGDPSGWEKEGFEPIEGILKAGYDLHRAVKAKKPMELELWKSEVVVRLEHTNPQFIDYILFAK